MLVNKHKIVNNTSVAHPKWVPIQLYKVTNKIIMMAISNFSNVNCNLSILCFTIASKKRMRTSLWVGAIEGVEKRGTESASLLCLIDG